MVCFHKGDTGPMSKDNRVFFFLFIVLKRTSIGVHKKNIIYQHICTKYILTVWSSFTPQCVPSYTDQEILVRKVNIHAYSMYVLLADNLKVSCPMTQHFDSGDSQISNPSIPSLTLYELR